MTSIRSSLTTDVIKAIEDEGWRVSSIGQGRSKAKDGYQKHVVRFRHESDFGRTLAVDEIIKEIVMRGSHSGDAKWWLDGGRFQMFL